MADKRAQQGTQGPRRKDVREVRRQRAQQKKTRRNVLIGVGTGAVAVVLIAAFILPSILRFGGHSGTTTPEEPVGEFHRSIGNQHVAVGTSPQYTTIPPTSGPHYATPAPWGVYDEPVLDQQAVHNMEHGGIVVSYNLTDPEGVTALRSFVEGQPGFPGCLLMRPYPEIAEGTIALTAWEWLQEFQSVETAGMQRFIDAHKNRGPESIDVGCGSGGQMIR